MINIKLHSLHQVNSNTPKTRQVCNCRNCRARNYSHVKLNNPELISPTDQKEEIGQQTIPHGVTAKDDLSQLQNPQAKSIATKLKQTEDSYITVTHACNWINKSKKAFVKGRGRYPKRQINSENLAAVNQAVTDPMFSPFLAHLNELNLSLHPMRINFDSVNRVLRKFDSKLFNKLMAWVYYGKARRPETTSVRINNALLKALEQTLWSSARNVKRNEFLNSTLLCMLACVDPEKANEVFKEILSNKKN